MFDFYLKQFQQYVKLFKISKNIENEILNIRFITRNPPFYLYYPNLFSEMLNVLDQNKINRLSIAGYFYYQSTLIMDTIIDEKNTQKYPSSTKCSSKK